MPGMAYAVDRAARRALRWTEGQWREVDLVAAPLVRRVLGALAMRTWGS